MGTFAYDNFISSPFVNCIFFYTSLVHLLFFHTYVLWHWSSQSYDFPIFLYFQLHNEVCSIALQISNILTFSLSFHYFLSVILFPKSPTHFIPFLLQKSYCLFACVWKYHMKKCCQFILSWKPVSSITLPEKSVATNKCLT